MVLAPIMAFFVHRRSARKRAAEIVALYPERDREVFRQFAFPWRFFKEKARRDGLTTRTHLHAAVLGYDSMDTRTTSKGIYDIYRFSGLIPFGDVELAITYTTEGELNGFDDLGAEFPLIE